MADLPNAHDNRIAATVLRETGESMLRESRHLREELLAGWTVAVQRIMGRAHVLDRRADRLAADQAQTATTQALVLAWDKGFMAAAEQAHPAHPRTRVMENPYRAALDGDPNSCGDPTRDDEHGGGA